MDYNIDGRKAIRLDDITDHGGKVIRVSSQTTVEGRCLARVGDLVRCPKCKGDFPIIEGHETLREEDIPIALEGHRTACGARLISSL